MAGWSRASALRRIVLVVAGLLIALEVAMLILGRFSPLVVLAILVLVYVNYFLWRRDLGRSRAPVADADIGTRTPDDQPPLESP